MSTAIESGIGTLNYGRQSAKGSIATAATTTVGYDRPRWVSGALSSKKTLASEEYVDGQRFGSPSTFTDKVGGAVGSVTIQVQPENAGLYAAQILGTDTVTGSGDPYTHVITSAGTSGAWGTWWQKVGSAIGPVRDIFWDSKIGKLVLSTGVSQKNLHYELDIVALVAGQTFTTDAAKTEATTAPYLWTEVTGAVTFDGTVITDVSEEMLTVDTGLEPWYGDSITPGQLIEKKGTITSSIKSIVTDGTLAKYRKAVYGATSVSAGDLPIKDVFGAALTTVYTRSATRTLTIARPNMQVDPVDMVVSAQPDGGANEISFGGACLKSGATAALTITVLDANATTLA